MKAAIILCAGFGNRLKEFTIDLPKPMLPILGKPILEYTIEHLSRLGINYIIINLHYLAEKITAYFKNGKKWNVNIEYSFEDYPLGTAGAVKKVEEKLYKFKNFFVLYGDIICNENYNDLLKFHLSIKNSIATIILHKRNKSNSIVKIDDHNKIIRFIERPKNNENNDDNFWVNSGLYCFSNKILNLIPKKKVCDFPKDIFPLLIKKGKIYGYPLKTYRCAIDSPERYKSVQNDFKENIINFNITNDSKTKSYFL